MQILDMLAILVLAGVALFVAIVHTSSHNKMRLGLWLLAKARSQQERETAAYHIETEARIWRADQEKLYLPRPHQVNQTTGEVIER